MDRVIGISLTPEEQDLLLASAHLGQVFIADAAKWNSIAEKVRQVRDMPDWEADLLAGKFPAVSDRKEEI